MTGGVIGFIADRQAEKVIRPVTIERAGRADARAATTEYHSPAGW